jgi:type I restriction enzyme S subunit
MSTFTESQLGSLIDTIIDYRGKTPKKLGGEWSSGGIPALSAKNIKQGKIVNPESIRYVDDALYKRWMKEEVKKGDLLMTSEAPLGETYYVKNDEKVLLSQRLFSIRTKAKELNSRFLYYYFNSKLGRHELLSRATGTTVGGIRQTALVKVLVRFPKDSEIQKEIAEVLGAYDDLIENNEKRIKALEEMAELLYTEWFVKFKFPGHEKIKLVDSGTSYGKIPEGWEVKKLGEVANVVRGCSYTSEEIDDFAGEYYIVNLKSFNRGGGFRFDGAKYYSGGINENQNLTTGDIVVAVTDMTNDRAVIARPARVPEIGGKITFSADVVKINSNILSNSFLYELLSSYKFTETTKQMANGANVLHLKPSAILEFVALIPNKELLDKFETLCKIAAMETDKLLKANDNLSKTRDLLIPQLVTGKRELKNI